jgi:hypothetical protein
MIYKRDELLKDLKENIVEVQFTKVNGQARTMRCTLLPKYLPVSYSENIQEQETEKKFHAENTDVIAVWDLNNGGWRSFRIESVDYAQVLDVSF